MTSSTQPPRRREARRRRREMLRSLLWLLPALAIALAVQLPFAHWVLEWRMAEFLVPWLLRPSTGFLSLTLALWWLFTMPSALRYMAGAERLASRRRSGSDEGTSPEPSGSAREVEAVERIAIPAGPLRGLGAGHRYEMAEALGIPWRDELIHDHQSWVRACAEAARAMAPGRSD